MVFSLAGMAAGMATCCEATNARMRNRHRALKERGQVHLQERRGSTTNAWISEPDPVLARKRNTRHVKLAMQQIASEVEHETHGRIQLGHHRHLCRARAVAGQHRTAG